MDAVELAGFAADHEGQGAGAGAHDAAGHGGVSEDSGRVSGGGDHLGHGAGGDGVDGGAVDEQAGLFAGWGGEWRGEDGVEDGFDVLGLREGGYDGVLVICC